MVNVLPRVIAPGVVRPPAVLAFSVILEFCSMAFVTPAAFTLRFSVPVVPPPCNPLVLEVVIPVIVPVPGNFWPLMNVTVPVLLILKAVPLTAKVLSVLFGNSVRVSRTLPLPFTSIVAVGEVVPKPICELFWNITESTMSLVVSHTGTNPATPFPVTVGFAGGTDVLFDAEGAVVLEPVPEAEPCLPLLASTKADGGNPPIVWASPAFIAYGTDTSSTRGCSSWPEICTPSQRASPLANESDSDASSLVEPSVTVYLPFLSGVMFWVSIHTGDPPCSSLYSRKVTPVIPVSGLPLISLSTPL